MIYQLIAIQDKAAVTQEYCNTVGSLDVLTDIFWISEQK